MAIEPGVKTKIMIIVPHYWGKGDTINEAWKQVKKESGKSLRDLKRDKHQIRICYDKPDDDQYTSLDSFGLNISYPEGYPPHIIYEHGT